MWVQLKSIKHIERFGKLKTYTPGDWVDVGKQTARRWLAQGDAWIPQGKVQNLMSRDCGIFVVGNKTQGEQSLGDYVGKIEVEYGKVPSLKWAKTLIYTQGLFLRRELVPIGFHLLDTWQCAIPLYDYKELAIHVGSPDEQEKTKSVVRDLRVPLYDNRLLFIRRSPDMQSFLSDYLAESGDKRHALLRTIYKHKPFVLALPTTWVNKDRQID